MQIEIFQSTDNKIELHVKLDQDTVWLTQAQLVALFESSKANISEHIKSILQSGELEPTGTVRKFRTVQQEGNRQVSRTLAYYNLDVIISVGYRVNSKRGIQFRQWATQRLKAYLVEGYAINQKRLEELGKVVQLIGQSEKKESLQLQEAKGLLEILSNYTKSFVLLNQYDSHNLQPDNLSENITYEIQYEEAKTAIAELKLSLIHISEPTRPY